VSAAAARLRRAVRSDSAAGWAFALPAVLLIGTFGLVPIAWSFVLSLQKSNLISPEAPFVGLTNYRALAHDPVFHDSVVHSLIYTALFVPISVGGGLALAIALNRRMRGIRFYRTAVFVPVVASTIATALMFLVLFDKNFGLANYVLGKLGLGPFGFFESTSGALYSIVALTVWGWLGFDVIIYLAALQGVPQELIEAAEIDGAGRWSLFRNVTLPLLGPATLFLVVWSTINALQLFDEVYFLTNGGPLHATYVVVFYLFDLAFRRGVAGYAAAIAYVLFVAILALTVVQLWVGKRFVHYSS
jgi:multiple sugar transport system permease protein